MEQIFIDLLGGGDELPPLESLLEEFASHFVHQLQTEHILRANTRDALKMVRGGLHYPGQPFEAAEGLASGLFAIPPWSCQGKEKFDNFFVS